ncbi:hypothetical protein DFS34DRAFT_328025 [Phlyctochytrium arcticum]|nr:hypothetical protein DFS34DRAFT_328025 [Phlyctochytrium arcticum]
MRFSPLPDHITRHEFGYYDHIVESDQITCERIVGLSDCCFSQIVQTPNLLGAGLSSVPASSALLSCSAGILFPSVSSFRSLLPLLLRHNGCLRFTGGGGSLILPVLKKCDATGNVCESAHHIGVDIITKAAMRIIASPRDPHTRVYRAHVALRNRPVAKRITTRDPSLCPLVVGALTVLDVLQDFGPKGSTFHFGLVSYDLVPFHFLCVVTDLEAVAPVGKLHPKSLVSLRVVSSSVLKRNQSVQTKRELRWTNSRA